MATGEAQRQDIQLRAPHGPLARIVFDVLGAGVITIVLFELGRALWPLGWWSPFFAIIIGGACWVGGKLLIAGIFGQDVRWTLRAREMCIEWGSVLRQRTDIYRAGDVVATAIKTHEWDSRPDRFNVVISLRSGETIDTPDVGTREKAVALETEIRSRLSVA